MAAVVTVISTELLKGIASGIGKEMGAKMFNSIFSESVPSYFTEVYKEIERIMHQELTENTINEINGQINGTTDWVKYVYNPRKDSGASKQELYALLEPKVSDLAINMIAVLKEDAFAESALAVFIIGAGIHYSLLQELATVDPNEDDPYNSSYILTIQGYAPDYASHAEKTWGAIKVAREAEVGEVVINTYLIPPLPGRPPTDYQWISTWTDNFTGETFTDVTDSILGKWTNGTWDDLKNRANGKRASYIESTIAELQNDMNDPPNAVDTWRKLVDQPLPIIE